MMDSQVEATTSLCQAHCTIFIAHDWHMQNVSAASACGWDAEPLVSPACGGTDLRVILTDDLLFVVGDGDVEQLEHRFAVAGLVARDSVDELAARPEHVGHRHAKVLQAVGLVRAPAVHVPQHRD